jgi:type III secretion protein U
MSSDKTERPTAKRLRDVRKKGQVAFSKEVVSSALILSFFALFIAVVPTLIQQLASLVLLPVPLLDAHFGNSADQLLHAYTTAMVRILTPFMLIVVVGTIVSCVFQFGLLFSFESVKPNLNKLNPTQYVKKVFGIQSLIEFLKSIVKILVLALLIFLVIRDGIRGMVLAPLCGIGCLQAMLGKMLMSVLLWASGPFAVIAAADFAFQRWNFTKKNMMSKDEIKREFKESEGDPQIKGMRRQLHQQLLAEGNINRARSATVLITNPSHVAVAIYYKKDETPLPVVTAIGTDAVAKRMIAAAIDAGVPVMQNVPLARSLLETGVIDQYIPSDLIEPFAEVLRALQALADSASEPAHIGGDGVSGER